MRLILIACFSFAVAACAAVVRAQPVPTTIPIPDGEAGIGFDDLRYAPALGRLLVPAGRTGAIVLVEPGPWRITRIGGFSARGDYGGGHDDGVTSADEGRGFVFATDRTVLRLVVVDPGSGRVVSSAKLAGGPDYVRYVERTGEVWVTQPDKERIEIFRLEGNPPKPVHDAFVDVAGGPESLVIDNARSRAYTHLWKGKTVALNVKNRGTLATWPNGCEGSRGIALDEERNFLFVGCAEGKGVSLDAKSGRVLGKIETGDGIDLVDYSPSLGHLYLAAGKSGTLGIAEVTPTGGLTLRAEIPTAKGAHCVAADQSGNAYVCDPAAGRILVVPDAVVPEP
jgi:DNA-binding beta-propeller fold protein YncE